MSIHVVKTQRGRVGAAYKEARSEAQLSPLRDEFVDRLEAAQAATVRQLRAAVTTTVTRHNLDGVHDVMRWLLGGHPACNRILHGLVARRAGEPPKYHAFRSSAPKAHAETVNEFFRRFGGVRFKIDTTGMAIARVP